MGKRIGTFKTVGDKEHAQIVENYRKGSSMAELARVM